MHKQFRYADSCLAAAEVNSALPLMGQCPERCWGGALPSSIRLLNWNVQKAHHPQFPSLFRRLSREYDLILVQEAVLEDGITNHLGTHYWNFAPGYRNARQQTGVMTASRAQALEYRRLLSREPWLRTPKAAAVSRFALQDSDQQLLVVNVHGINFTLGLVDYRRQLGELASQMVGHRGPVIFAGDFNTWSTARLREVEAIAREFGLYALKYEQDHRTRVFGCALDHIYVRDLSINNTNTLQTHTSDHNILTAEVMIAAAAEKRVHEE
ncbi:MAG: endonuclease/exonuclease/phosphatase family protein [Gammaproteobacteria bacterium]|nr:endonuclease/exonuclease/phosphatase family protein [Gammaproteobacteria bacterium]